MQLQTCPNSEVILAIKAVICNRRSRGATRLDLKALLDHMDQTIWRHNWQVRLGILAIRRVFNLRSH